MGNISHSLKKVLQQAQLNKSLEKFFKECLLAKEYKHIINIRRYKGQLFVYLDSSVALYELNLKKDGLSGCLQQKGLDFTRLIFKVTT
jgi:hypothetical protein